MLEPFPKCDSLRNPTGRAKRAGPQDLEISEILENLEKYIVKPNKAHVFLSTTHQAKGLEFKHVVLANDFSKMYDREKGKYVKLPNHKTEDAHVLFTAMTRAKLSLTMPISDDEE